MGSPNVGKSVVAALVFADLKLRGIDCELVQERAKEWHRAGRLRPEDQVLTTMEQIARERALEGSVDVVVTDSPPVLGMAYSSPAQVDVILSAINNLCSSWAKMAWVLERDVRPDYDQNGRRENADQSLALQPEIRGLAERYYDKWESVDLNVEKSAIPLVARNIADAAVIELRYLQSEAAMQEEERRAARESWTARQTQ